MLCEEKLEVFENGFEDGRFHVRIEYYGSDARKVLLAAIFDLYRADYGTEYVYPFECAKEFWGIYMDASEVEGEELPLRGTKFVNRSLLNRLEGALEDIEAPPEVREHVKKALEGSEIYKLKDGLIAFGRDFVLDEGRGRLFLFNKPSVRELITPYLRKW
ncbi:PH1570 family protein [Palaeococcus ferrophilus]|uniref:PH1570 family protein n=1 Tax=Palaeococcus ferrophilus TaxID=83868 RepID=UPI00064FF191|nr:PH1570 family protein [Palaeococcus ferrophilus]